MMSDPERNDLSSLDLQADRVERMVSTILERAAFELKRRQRAGVLTLPGMSVLDGLLGWARPALATAAALAVISLAALSRLDRVVPAGDDAAFFQSAALPAPVQVWLEEGQPPSVVDLFAVADGENR